MNLLRLAFTACLIFSTAFSAIAQDTDMDGLSDTDEAIHGTDINNPDSDGDTIIDDWEVQMGDDPLAPRYSFDSHSWADIRLFYISSPPPTIEDFDNYFCVTDDNGETCTGRAPIQYSEPASQRMYEFDIYPDPDGASRIFGENFRFQCTGTVH